MWIWYDDMIVVTCQLWCLFPSRRKKDLPLLPRKWNLIPECGLFIMRVDELSYSLMTGWWFLRSCGDPDGKWHVCTVDSGWSLIYLLNMAVFHGHFCWLKGPGRWLDLIGGSWANNLYEVFPWCSIVNQNLYIFDLKRLMDKYDYTNMYIHIYIYTYIYRYNYIYILHFCYTICFKQIIR